ncbi:hypothetical protein GCM10010388_69450 [Streptomyces mauvecolor]|uniref:CHAT domain-containing protein n=1 Tax=Streptomyces mauvecolor TaxID=58345 RepID=UPI0031E105F9
MWPPSTAIQESSNRSADPEEQEEAEATVVATLAWLWSVLAEPVLDRLGLGPRPDGDTAADPWPRLWWSPTGLLNFLPLHAAGTFETGASALDRVVSSYTPTLRMLGESRRPRVPAATEPRLLVVALPRTPGMTALDGVSREVMTLAKRFGKLTPLIGPNATTENILRVLPRHPWVHIGCHALTNLAQPSESHLVAHDGRVSIRDLAGVRTEQGELAFLAACDTVRGAPGIPDEAIHLGAAFQLAGYRHVIGTLWEAADDVAARIVEDVYKAVPRDSPIASGIPIALHTAVCALRQRYPRVPSLWSGYAHFGP